MNITSIMYLSNSIGKTIVERMKHVGIDSIEKLASSKIESLLAIDGIGIIKAKYYIEFAKKHIERIKAKQKIQNMINKAGTPNESKSTDNLNTQQPLDQEGKSNAPVNSIQKIASLNANDLSKIKGMSAPEAQRYIKIAKDYLQNMRKKEIISKRNSSESNSQIRPLGFIKLSNNGSINDIKNSTIPIQKENISLEKPKLDIKSFKEQIAKKGVKDKPVKRHKRKPLGLKTFFKLETMQRIRFLHYKIKNLEEKLARNEEFNFSELNNIIDYIELLNVNYKTQSQIKIFKELDITSIFYDPLAKKEIQIWDLIFECSRVLWISAQAYFYLASKFEEENLLENAIVSMVECSKMYKTAAYFSAACTRQEEKGIALSVENLEMNSEECRILAQNLATISEEQKGNYSMAANLSAGLSALSKRLTFLRKYDDKREKHFKAQYNYDIGRACHLKAKSLLKLVSESNNEEKIKELQKKAVYYYMKAEAIWEYLLNQTEDLPIPEKKNLRINLSVVNEMIIENDAEIINDEEALEIQDPEPLIIIPENLAPFVPKTTNFLTNVKQTDLNFNAYQRYRNLMSDVLVNFDKIEELRHNKAGIGRTLKQLQILYENNDIDINNFTELYEKYSIKLESVEAAIQNLKNSQKKQKRAKPKEEILKSVM